MNLPAGVSIVYIGVIPGIKNLNGQLFRTDLAGCYNTDLEGAKYLCEINGGKTKYFFIEERYYLSYKPQGEKLGNIKKIHHFNQVEFPIEITAGTLKISAHGS